MAVNQLTSVNTAELTFSNPVFPTGRRKLHSPRVSAEQTRMLGARLPAPRAQTLSGAPMANDLRFLAPLGEHAPFLDSSAERPTRSYLHLFTIIAVLFGRFQDYRNSINSDT